MKKWRVAICGIVVVVTVSLTSMFWKMVPEYLVPWMWCKWWHFVHEEELEFNKLRLILPKEWWIMESDGSVLRLSAIPPENIPYFGLVTIRQGILTREQLNSMTEKKVIGSDKVNFAGIFSREIGGEKSLGIRYDVPKEPKRKFEIWTIPNTSTVIRVVKTLKEDEGLLEKLFQGISFPKASEFLTNSSDS